MKHDHRRSIWLIAGGHIIWCYRCGAWRMNGPGRWYRPTGPKGKNPAMAIDFVSKELADTRAGTRTNNCTD